jgi:quaternary ammonium compound-resistance protein SugE
MGWLYLIVAGLIEVVMAYALKQSEGWSRLLPSVIAIVAAGASIFWLTKALKHLPLGSAYAIWTGIGSLGVVLVGIAFLGESASLLRLACIALVVAGTIGLRLSGA